MEGLEENDVGAMLALLVRAESCKEAKSKLSLKILSQIQVKRRMSQVGMIKCH